MTEKLINQPNSLLPKKRWTVYQVSRGGQGTDRLQNIGHVEGVDYGEASSMASQRYGAQGFDYLKPPSEKPLVEAKIGFPNQATLDQRMEPSTCASPDDGNRER